MKSKKTESVVKFDLIDDHDLPEGWVKKSLLEVVGGEPRLVVGGPFGSCIKVDDYQKTGIPIIRLQNVGHAKFIDKDIKYLTLEKAKELEYHTFAKGDLVLAKLGDPIGKTCIIPDKFEWGIVVSDVVRIRIENDQIDKKYLLYYLNSSHSINQINSQVFGSTRPRVNLKEVRDIVILVPPLPEQQRIVARVEALLTQVDVARERLQRVPLIMKKFRQAVLAAACSGRLTEGWREKHNDHFENNSIVRVVQNNANNKKILRDFGWIQENAHPDNWLLTHLDDLATVDTGTTPSRKNPEYWNGGTIPWVTSGELYNSFVTKTNENVTEQALKETRLKIFPKGTLLIALYGQGLTRGKSSELAIEATTNQACGTINIFDTLSEIKPYIKLFLQKNYLDIRNLSAGGVQPNLNLSKIKAMPIPLPPLAEQQEIVRRVEALFARADAVEREVAAATKRADALTQAVLAKAFAGKL